MTLFFKHIKQKMKNCIGLLIFTQLRAYNFFEILNPKFFFGAFIILTFIYYLFRLFYCKKKKKTFIFNEANEQENLVNHQLQLFNKKNKIKLGR